MNKIYYLFSPKLLTSILQDNFPNHRLFYQRTKVKIAICLLQNILEHDLKLITDLSNCISIDFQHRALRRISVVPLLKCSAQALELDPGTNPCELLSITFITIRLLFGPFRGFCRTILGVAVEEGTCRILSFFTELKCCQGDKNH